MSEQNNEGRPEEAPKLDAEEARQGEIVLRTKRRRQMFFGLLVALILLAVILGLAA